MSRPIALWRNIKKLPHLLNKTATLIVWTKIHVAPEGFEDYGTYISGIVEFEDHTRMPVQVVDCEEVELKVGMQVKTVIRRGAHVSDSAIIEYVIKVKPI